MSVHHILHRFLICLSHCPPVLSHWSCMSLCCAPLWMGDEEREECSGAKTIPKDAGLSECSEDAGSFQQLAQTSEPKLKLGSKRPNSSEGLTGFLPKVRRVKSMTAEEILRLVVVHKVTSTPTTAAILPFISSSCCVEASSSSSGSSHRVSPGRAAGPGHPVPSNSVCGAVWMS